MHFKEQIIPVPKENKTCHLSLCMSPRKAMGFWVNAHLSLMTSLHTSRTFWRYWAQRDGYSDRGASASSPVLTIPPGLSLFSFSLRSIQTVPLFSPPPPDAIGTSLPLLRVTRTNRPFPWYTVCLRRRWDLQHFAIIWTHQLVARGLLLIMICLVPFLSAPWFIYLMDPTSMTL